MGFDQILLQIAVVTNGTTAEVAGDAFINSINSLLGAITALVGSAAGIIIALIAARSAGRAKTKQEEQTVGYAEAIQLVMQKIAESRAEIRQVSKGTLALATTEEQKKQLDAQVAPVLQTTKEGIDTIYAQIPAIKALLGVKIADVNTITTLPRESEEVLKILNEAIAKIKAGE